MHTSTCNCSMVHTVVCIVFSVTCGYVLLSLCMYMSCVNIIIATYYYVLLMSNFTYNCNIRILVFQVIKDTFYFRINYRIKPLCDPCLSIGQVMKAATPTRSCCAICGRWLTNRCVVQGSQAHLPSSRGSTPGKFSIPVPVPLEVGESSCLDEWRRRNELTRTGLGCTRVRVRLARKLDMRTILSRSGATVPSLKSECSRATLDTNRGR